MIKVAAAACLLAGLLPATSNATSSGAVCPSPKPPPLKFGKPIYIDENRSGGEPVNIVAQDGSIIVSAHASTTLLYKDPASLPGAADYLGSYYNQTLNWRSTDGGKTWAYVGLAGQPTGPHTPTSTGFSDPDLTMDAGGRIYNVEIDLANNAVFSSSDDGQSWPRGNPEVAPGDRPWVTGAEADEVFLYVNSLPKGLYRSTDGGLTFTPVSQDFPAVGKLYVDPLNPKTGLIGPMVFGVAISEDDGSTWKEFPNALGKMDGMPIIAADREGWIYQAAAGGYMGPADTKADGEVTYSYFDRSTKEWAPTIEIPTPPGDAMWAWMTAGDDGRVAITWYQTLKGKPDEFYIYTAYTLNGHGSKVRCSDGSTKTVPPQFQVTNASGRPIHVGDICLSGTACNAGTDFKAGDRRLGDFFTVGFDHTGAIFMVSGDTMLTSPTEGPKPVANPIFVKQKSGARLLVKPDKVRETRPLCALPTC